jgi:hypothetical protein
MRNMRININVQMASAPIYTSSLQTFRSGKSYGAIVLAFGQGHLTDNIFHCILSMV